jgi:hypothetical protein
MCTACAGTVLHPDFAVLHPDFIVLHPVALSANFLA